MVAWCVSWTHTGVSPLGGGLVTVAAAGGTIQVMAVMGLPQCGQGRTLVLAPSPGTVAGAVMVLPPVMVLVVPGAVMVARAGGGMGPAA
jgi:hypothetical protein